jgi:subtilisin family serine protease
MADDHRKSTDPSDRFARTTVPGELNDPDRRVSWGLPADENEPGRYVVELNLQHIEGLPGAAIALQTLCSEIGSPRPKRVAKTYYSCRLTVPQVRKLVVADEQAAEAAAVKAAGTSAPADSFKYRAIFRIWPDFPVRGQIDRSVATVKADAAMRAFAAGGSDIVWAVIDSGVDVAHPHFGKRAEAESGDAQARARHTLLADSVHSLHRCFCELQTDPVIASVRDYLDDPDDPITPDGKNAAALPPDERQKLRTARVTAHVQAALKDPFGHGTHVAGIIAGGLPEGATPLVLQREYRVDQNGTRIEKNYATRTVGNPQALHGIARDCKIISLRVLDETGNGHTSDIMRALEYIREQLNDDPKVLRVHGVNLSVGYEFDAELFACGQSPLCAEVDRLVQAGVVVVAAAGNTGYGHVQADARISKVGLSNTINDPGNAALAITVGSTHRDSPHTYGVSYFSSKGPTGDGRLKPDLVAPGERITSCATGAKLQEAADKNQRLPIDGNPCYIDDSGTSMAAPHVSGAIAAFLSIRREFVGKPLDVKRIFLESATPLGRERYFEGHGLVDLMRAIQSV